MKKRIENLSPLALVFGFLTVMCLFFLNACGGEEEELAHTARDFFVIETTEQQLQVPGTDAEWRCLGMQFSEGEVLQIWGNTKVDENGQTTWDIYLSWEDGRSELVFGGISTKYRSGWHRDEEGSFYILQSDTIVKIDSAGKEIFRCKYEGRNFLNLYQDSMSRWMLIGEAGENTIVVSELNKVNGEITDKSSFLMEEGLYYVAGQEDGAYAMDKQGVWFLDVEKGEKELAISFQDTNYALGVKPTSFRVKDDGEIEVL